MLSNKWRYGIYSAPFILFFISLFIGKYPLTPSEVLSALLGDKEGIAYTIVWDIRMPRVLLAIVGGASLAVAGAVLQGMFRNPLVSPSILGISAGASFGAAIAIVFLSITPYIPAFAFALLAAYITYSIAKVRENIPRLSLVLSGIIVASLFSAMLYVVKYLADPYHLTTVVYWLMGSFNYAHWSQVICVYLAFLIGFTLIYCSRWHLNIVSLGDEEAKALGVNVKNLRFMYISTSALLASAITAVCGIIGWIGLIVPHITRMAFGADHKTLIPLSATVGATLMLAADDVVRVVLPYELPISVITTLLGIPFFIYLLRRGRIW